MKYKTDIPYRMFSVANSFSGKIIAVLITGAGLPIMPRGSPVYLLWESGKTRNQALPEARRHYKKRNVLSYPDHGECWQGWN